MHIYMNKVAIIILQYGNAEATIDCITSVEQYNTYPVKYIVVDNASPRDECEVLQKYVHNISQDVLEVSDNAELTATLPKFTIVKSVLNDGYARGNNKGLRLAYEDNEVDKILILNNDILFVEDIIPKLVRDIQTLNDCALISPLLYKRNLDGFDVNCARYCAKFFDLLLNNILVFRYGNKVKRPHLAPDTGIMPVELISGSCMMACKNLFQSIGGFDPGTFLYYEENILSEKIKRVCLRNYLDTDLKCIHLGASTTEKSQSRKITRIGFESQYYFVKSYHRLTGIKLPILKLSQWWVLSLLAFKDLFRWKRLK